MVITPPAQLNIFRKEVTLQSKEAFDEEYIVLVQTFFTNIYKLSTPSKQYNYFNGLP